MRKIFSSLLPLCLIFVAWFGASAAHANGVREGYWSATRGYASYRPEVQYRPYRVLQEFRHYTNPRNSIGLTKIAYFLGNFSYPFPK